MDLDKDTRTANVGFESVSPEELVIEEHSYSASALQLYSCRICNDAFTSRNALFSHKLRCYLELDQSNEAVDQDVISNELKSDIRSGDELSHLDNEVETVSNNPVEESGADLDENLGSVGDKSLICVSETDDEPLNILNDSVGEDINENETSSLVNCELPLRVSEPDDKISNPFSNPAGKVDINRVENPDLMSCSSSPLRISEPDEETSSPPNSLVDKANADQNEIPDSTSCELPLQICDAVYEPSTSTNHANETETNQKDPRSMSCQSPQPICKVDNDTSNEADTDHSMLYELPSDNDQVDSKIGIKKIQNLYPNIQSVPVDEPMQQKIIYFDHSRDPSSTNKIDTTEVVNQILFPIDSNTTNEFTKEPESNSATESTETHQNHVTASFTNDNDDLDSIEEIEEISIEIDLDEITTTEDHSSRTKKRILPKKSSRCDKCNRNFSTKQALALHNRLAPRCRGSFKCKQCDYRARHSYNLKYHITTEHQRGHFTCHICGKVLNNKISLQSHLRFVHTNKKFTYKRPTKTKTSTKTAQYVCDYCQKSFLFKNNLRKHIIQHNSAHKCDQCDKYLLTKGALILHKMSHSSLPLKCEKCDFTAKHRKIINDHMKKEHDTEGSVNCDICGECFKSKQSLFEHSRRTHLACRTRSRRRPNEFGEWVCEHCQKSFDSYKKLRNHIVYYHIIEETICEICSKSFRNKYHLNVHRQYIHIKPFRCEICDFRSGSRTQWDNHYRVHSGEKPFICDVCDKSYSMKYLLKRHRERSHLNMYQYICDHCQQNFQSKNDLREHIKSTHVLIFNYDKCSERYDNETELFSHKSTHTPDCKFVPPKFVCEICERACTNKGGLTRHQRLKHPKLLINEVSEPASATEAHSSTTSVEHFLNPFTCEICEKTCANQSGLTQHRRQKHPKSLINGVNEPAGATKAHLFTTSVNQLLNPFTCEICDYTARTLEQIQNHFKIVHIGEKPFVCKCGKKFSIQKDFKLHQKVHENAQFYCDFCEVGFRIENTFRDHMRSTHQPFICETCNYNCETLAMLMDHMKSTHEPFTCEICNFSCENIAFLTDHFRVHTGEKPYLCEKCNKRFSTNALLRSHMLTWHRTPTKAPILIDTITID